MALKDTFDNLMNRGPFQPKTMPAADLSKVEDEVHEITAKLEIERKNREQFDRLEIGCFGLFLVFNFKSDLVYIVLYICFIEH